MWLGFLESGSTLFTCALLSACHVTSLIGSAIAMAVAYLVQVKYISS
jgi:hypothetical protein